MSSGSILELHQLLEVAAASALPDDAPAFEVQKDAAGFSPHIPKGGPIAAPPSEPERKLVAVPAQRQRQPRPPTSSSDSTTS